MTVKELIEKLGKYPGHYGVEIFCDYCGIVGIDSVDCVVKTDKEGTVEINTN